MRITRSLLALAVGLMGAANTGLLSPPAAHAHAIESSLEFVSGARDTYSLQSHFSTGGAVAGAAVSLVAPDGQSLALGQTDAQGELRFAVPAAADSRWEVRVDQGPGHRDYLELPPRSSHLQQVAVPPAWSWASAGSVLLVGTLALRLRGPRL